MASKRVQYLNTDLVLQSGSDLAPIVKAFGDDVVVLHSGAGSNGIYRAAFEIAGSHAGATEDINYFIALVEALPPDIRNLWDSCYSRVFDVGYRSGADTPSFTTELRSATIKAMAAINASVAITIYPAADG